MNKDFDIAEHDEMPQISDDSESHAEKENQEYDQFYNGHTYDSENYIQDQVMDDATHDQNNEYDDDVSRDE